MATTVWTEAGGFSTVIPDMAATGQMMVEFSRNIKDFKINQYSELRPVTKLMGFYVRIRPASAGRVRWPDAREYSWAPGGERPRGQDNQLQFTYDSYRAQRYAHSVVIDNLGMEQADWGVLEAEMRDKAQQAMTMITDLGLNALATATWGANQANVDGAAGTLGGNAALLGSGHNWGNGTSANPYIRISLYAAALQINKATLGRIRPQDLVLTISPDTAATMSQSGEVQGILSNSVYAYPMLTGTLPGTQQNWSLPPKLYDFRIAVEDAVVVTSNKNNTGSDVVSYALPGPGTATTGAVAYLLARKDNELVNPTVLRAEEGDVALTEEQRSNIPVTSTLTRFAHEEFTVESRVNQWDRLTESSVAHAEDFRVTNAISGFMLNHLFG